MCAVNNDLHAQETSLRKITVGAQVPVRIDSMLLSPNSLGVFCKGTKLSSDNYTYSNQTNIIEIHTTCSDSIEISYRVLPIQLTTVYQKRDSSMLYTDLKSDRDKFLIQNIPTNEDIFGGSSITKSGSISRGITFGNNQNLGVNSSLNLELSGNISPNLKMLAVVSDNNLPIQPEGNTNQLREFDQVFIQIYNDRLKLIAGDFWLRKPKGYFTNYQKRAQGLSFENQWKFENGNRWTTQISGALSRGKFNRQIVPGVEGNQGPYRLIGVENEPFIIILSGTEKVFIDGKLLERGQEFDYTINYNTAEVIFTSRNQITKDSRIVIEFQYSDQNYARSILQNSTTFTSKKFDFWFNAYSEQDAKNQTLQQELSLDQKKLLTEIGDSLILARTTSIDSVGFLENQVLYELKDSLGFDSVLVFSIDQNLGVYRAVFQFVGQGNGDYILDNFNALGRVYKWVSPVAGIPQGNYAASRLLVAPQKQQMVATGFKYRINDKWEIENETALSVFDVNTFSRLDANDNNGFANRFKIKGTQNLSRDSLPKWKMETTGEVEFLQKYFKPIQQYRAVEFDRDWNTRNQNFEGNQLYVTASEKFIHNKNGFFNFEGQHFGVGNDFSGFKGQTNGNWKQNGFSANWIASALSSDASGRNNYIRNKVDISQKIGKIRIGYKDDQERNTFKNTLPLEKNSYQFYDYQIYVANGDSARNNFKLFYRERFDWLSDSTRLKAAAKATTAGGEFAFLNLKNQRLNIVTSYRQLEIRDANLINQTPENSLLGRLDYEIRVWKNALTFNNFYEAGSGLELKREFLYIKVNDGQGVYTWNDYNGDGIKDLNEFEIAQFIDQASYIRVFTPSNEYVKTFSNELNQSIFWRPERLWAKKKGFLKYVAIFSDQARFRVNKRTTGLSGFDAFNPLDGSVRDTNLISTNSSVRNTLFFNRTSNIFTAQYNFQDIRSKTLLASGFDARSNKLNGLKGRLNLRKIFSIEYEYQRGNKLVEADYTSGRNYNLNYFFHQPSFIFQPSTSFRISLEAKYTEKKNAFDLGGETAYLGELGTTLKYNQQQKGSLQANFKTVNIAYGSDPNSALGFEMLEGLKTGINYTWTFGYQRSISKNLQISIQYNGRKSEDNKTIHSGGMEVRAFF